MNALKKKNKGAEGFIYGSARIEVAPEDLLTLLNILLGLGIAYKNITERSVDLAYPCALRAKRACEEMSVEADVTLLGGLPHIFFGLLKRPGLIAGMLIAIIITVLGNSVLWDIRVEGNAELSADRVESILADHGIRPGARLGGLDIGTVQSDIERESGEIAWISVNVIGTVAYVEVIEAQTPPVKAEPEGDGANLVAERGGMIVGFELTAGEPIAEYGKTVKKGELLVSGLYDSERFGYRAVEARGKVFARTEYEFEVEIPCEYRVREPEKREICEISLIFFGFRQKFFKKGGFSGSEYDTIYSDIYIYNFKGATIPVGLAVASAPIYRDEVVLRTLAEARDLAHFEINRRILSALPEAEILSRSYEAKESAAGYRLTCRVECIDNIARSVPFYITQNED